MWNSSIWWKINTKKRENFFLPTESAFVLVSVSRYLEIRWVIERRRIFLLNKAVPTGFHTSVGIIERKILKGWRWYTYTYTYFGPQSTVQKYSKIPIIRGFDNSWVMDNSWTKKTNKFLKSQSFDIWGLKVCEFVHFCMCEFVYVRIMGVTNYPINPVKTCTNYGYFTVVTVSNKLFDYTNNAYNTSFDLDINRSHQSYNTMRFLTCFDTLTTR